MSVPVTFVLVALAVAVLLAASSRRRQRPRAGEIWFVEFPFADDWTKSKDRPVLVVSVTNQTALVRKITSQDQTRRPHEYDLLPREHSGLAKTSWIKKAPDNVALRHFRRKAGSASGRRGVRAA